MKYTRKILLWLPSVLWYRLIWNFSAQSANVSGDLSGRLLWRLMALASPAFAGAAVGVQTAAVELLSFFERKAAHMFLYFVLILLLWLALLPLKGRRKQISLAAILCVVLAALDEYHQTFIPGRSGQLRDVCIDMAGAAIAVLLVAVLLWTARRRRKRCHAPIAWLPLALCAVLAVMIAAVPVSFSELPVFAWATERFVPDFPAADHPALAPLLREACFLAVCCLLGCCGQFSVALAIWKPLPAAGAAMGLSAALAALPALLWHLPVLPAISLVAAGWTAGTAIWLICFSAGRIPPKWIS